MRISRVSVSPAIAYSPLPPMIPIFTGPALPFAFALPPLFFAALIQSPPAQPRTHRPYRSALNALPQPSRHARKEPASPLGPPPESTSSYFPAWSMDTNHSPSATHTADAPSWAPNPQRKTQSARRL